MIQGKLTRAEDTSGESIKTYKDGSLHVQTVVLADESGCPVGNIGNPLPIWGITSDLALYPNPQDSEQLLIVGTTVKTAASLASTTTHVYWSASNGGIWVSFRTSPSQGAGIYLASAERGIWHASTIQSASFIGDSPSSKIFLSPFRCW